MTEKTTEIEASDGCEASECSALLARIREMKPEIGQQLFSLNIGNAARIREQELTAVEVVKVGRKYFTCKVVGRSCETQYLLDDWTEDTQYCASSKLYADEQSYYDEKERSGLYSKIRDAFDLYRGNKHYTLIQLREIAEIIAP